MKMISLFDGIGGFPLAAYRAGLLKSDKDLTVCEIDKQARSVTGKHFPEALVVDDVRKVGRNTHERNSVDIITGGFPCQDVSVAGKRAGFAGERSSLWFEFARVIDELEPGWVVAENVPGILSSYSGDEPPSDLQEGQEWETTEESDFFAVIQWLAERGYGVCWRVLDAQYFGVPQRRRRVFIVASLGNGRSAEVLFERESGAGYFEPGGKTGKEVAHALTASPTASPTASGRYDPSAETYIIEQNNVASTPDMISLRSNPAVPVVFDGRNLSTGEQSITLQAKNSGGYSLNYTPMVFQQNQRDEVMGTGGNQVPMVTMVNTAHSGANQNNAKIGTVMDTLDTWASVAVQQPTGVRRLTPLECERLQGFPDGWTDGQSDSSRYKQLGNAVAIPPVEWLMRRIKRVDEKG